MAAPDKLDRTTDAGIERERVKWTSKRIAAHLNFVKQLSFHTSPTFMDYLHGDVDEEEAELACRYEYARELQAVWEAANQRDEWKVKGLDGFSKKERNAWKKLSPAECGEKAARWAFQERGLQGQTFFPFDILSFLVCESFPKKDWNALAPAERTTIARFERKKIPPLPMPDVWTLKGILEAPPWSGALRALVEKSTPVIEEVPPGKIAKPMKLVWPVLQMWESVYYVVFDVDYSKSETQLVNEFHKWLRLPENRERLEKYKKPTTGTTGKALDRLKDLAAWRLYREHGNDWNEANHFAREHRKKFTSTEIRQNFKTKAQREKFSSGSYKPFRDAKWQDGKPANEADLFGEDADARKAQASAWGYMVEIMPQKFASPGPHMLAVFAELTKLASEG